MNPITPRLRSWIVCALLATLLTLLLGARAAHAVVVELSLEELTLGADLILHGRDVSGQPDGSEFDLQSVVLHEFGHYLCLAHDPDPGR